MGEPYWEVYINVGHVYDVPEVYLVLHDVLNANIIEIADHPMPVEAVTANQLRVRSIGGRWEWAVSVGGDLQFELESLEITSTVTAVRKEG